MIAFVDGRPVCSVIAPADLRFSQVRIGNEKMTAAGDHLDVMAGHGFVFTQRFQQIQGRCADGTVIFQNCITELHHNMTMQTEILRIIRRAADPLKLVSFDV